jgi:carbonic anhydrase
MSNPVIPSRRGFLQLGGLAALGLVLDACGASDVKKVVAGAPMEEPVDDPETALLRLLEGNQRFVDDKSLPINEGKDRRAKVAKRQRPFAAILSCIDSSVPPELIFDRGLGDLLVVRSAGEVLDNAVLGSLEYGAGELEVPLLVVLGHTACGAVKATVEAIDTNQPAAAEVNFVVEALKPAVAKAKTMKPKAKTTTKKATTTTAESTAETKAEAKTKEAATTTTTTEAKTPDQELVDAAVEVNVEMIVERLKTTAIIGDRIKKNWLLLVGGVYDLASGKVDITVGMPDTVKTALDEATSTTVKAGDKKSSDTKAGEKTTTTKKA